MTGFFFFGIILDRIMIPTFNETHYTSPIITKTLFINFDIEEGLMLIVFMSLTHIFKLWKNANRTLILGCICRAEFILPNPNCFQLESVINSEEK